MQECAKTDRQDEKNDGYTQRWDESREASSHVVYPRATENDTTRASVAYRGNPET